MGDEAFMRQQIIQKIETGFNCIKLKIGAIDFQTELNILKFIRKEFSVSDIELRVDANGAFDPDEALEKLKRLSEYQLHSIEQPIKPQQFDDIAKLCHLHPEPLGTSSVRDMNNTMLHIFVPIQGQQDSIQKLSR